MKVSIIVPVYNEFRTLNLVLDRIRRAPLPEGCVKEIVVVDDGSTDGTAHLLQDQIQSGWVVGQHSEANVGKGAAIRMGIELASGDIILIQDGDLEYDPNDYRTILEPIVQGRADVVYGSRFRGSCSGMALKNRIANWILTVTANIFYRAGLTDEATAYKAFRSAVLRDIQLECQRFEFCPEITAKLRLQGRKIHEVPIRYNARRIAAGKKIRARDGFEAWWTLLKYRVPLLRGRNAVRSKPLRSEQQLAATRMPQT
jgi:dolichol-phosphate mannosyltransferase